MTCDERRDQILLYAAGALDAAERRELEGHFRAGCPRCAGSLAESQAMLAHLPHALAPVPPSSEVKRRLLARVASTSHLERPSPARTTLPFPSPQRERRVERWLSPALAAGLAAATVYALIALPVAREREGLRADLATQAERIRALETTVERQSEAARMLQSREAVVATLAGSEPQPEAWGRILWDRERRVVHFYTGNLKPLAAGRTYELWLITDGQEKIPAGTFDLDASHKAQLVTRLTADVGNVVLAAVTDEPAGGVPQPTGSIQLVGKLTPAI